MELKQLSVFKTIVDEGSISAAARVLHTAQPPLSFMMKQLESELGCTLFLRGARTIRLTDAGRLLYSRACDMLDMAGSTLQAMGDLSQGNAGTLRLGIVSSCGDFVLRNILLSFHKQHPAIHYHLTEADTYTLLDALEQRQLDIAFVRTPFPSGKFKVCRLHDEALVAAALPELLSESDITKGISLERMAALPLIVYRRWSKIIEQEMHASGQRLLPFCLADDARTCINWAKNGMGVAVIPASAITAEDPGILHVCALSDAGLRSSIVAVSDPDHYCSPAMHMLLESLHKLS